jgi:type VI secretion system protein ImpK
MRLSDFFIPLMAYVRSFETATAGAPQEVSACIDRLIEQASSQALNAGIEVQLFHQALFPVAAWADEHISRRKIWASAMAWQPFLLQRRYFKTSVAGREFFERLQALTADEAPVREIYLLCLCMGFVGRYGSAADSAELSQLRLDQYGMVLEAIGASNEGADLPLFPMAYRTADASRFSRASRWPRWLRPTAVLVVLVPVALLVLLTFTLDAELASSIRAFRRSIFL